MAGQTRPSSRSSDSFDRVARGCGVAAPLVSLGAILLATALSPDFSWTESALSELGRPEAATAALFNGGLLLGGALALPFVGRVAVVADHALTRLGSLAFGLAAVAMALVGLFPTGTAFHFPAALSLYAFVTYGLFLYGSGRALVGRVQEGVLSIWLGVVHVTSWMAWGLGLRLGPGLAIPETVGAVIFAAWVAVAWRSLSSPAS